MTDVGLVTSEDESLGMGSLLHDGALFAIERSPEMLTFALSPGVGDFPPGPVFRARFSGPLTTFAVYEWDLPDGDPPTEIGEERSNWFDRGSRRSLDWATHEAELRAGDVFEILQAELLDPEGPMPELELYGYFGRRTATEPDRWRWICVRARSIVWERMDGTPLDRDMMIALSIVWWDHWSAGPPRTMTAQEAAAAGPLRPGTKIAGLPE